MVTVTVPASHTVHSAAAAATTSTTVTKVCILRNSEYIFWLAWVKWLHITVFMFSGFDLPRHTWSLMNRFRAGQGPCRDDLQKWGLAQSPSCDCGQWQTMDHIVDTCPLTKLEGWLNLLHEVDDDAVIWLESTVTAALAKINSTNNRLVHSTWTELMWTEVRKLELRHRFSSRAVHSAWTELNCTSWPSYVTHSLVMTWSCTSASQLDWLRQN